LHVAPIENRIRGRIIDDGGEVWRLNPVSVHRTR
jgi:hypothetical protein